MNVKRFIGRNSRDAMQKVRLAFGDNAVVLSTKPCAEGIEVLAMPPESVDAIERMEAPMHEPAPLSRQAFAAAAAAARPQETPAQGRSLLARLRGGAASPAATDRPGTAAPVSPNPVQEDVGTLAMSTLSFQDYVRERMLKKREAELQARTSEPVPVSPDTLAQRLNQRVQAGEAMPQPSYPEMLASASRTRSAEVDLADTTAFVAPVERAAAPRPATRVSKPVAPQETAPAALDDGFAESDLTPLRASRSERSASRDQSDMMSEIRAMKGLIEERFGALAFMERMQKNPRQAQLITRLIDCGFSPALIRKLGDSMPENVSDELIWAGSVLQRNLNACENEPPIEDQGGVYAMVGSTGVGKTTSTAKLAAAFAAKHGAAHLGLITLDAYRLGAHEQLRGYGRILGVPVHTAHDKVALEDLLDLLSAKKLVLIDTAGLAQRDTRTRELLEMLQHRAIKRLLVVNAAQQGESIEDVLSAYKASQAKGIVLSKMDEAVKLGPALDAMIRNRLKIVAVANGQRVPEDWHRLTASALIQRALRSTGSQAWRMDVNDVNLMFTTPAPAAPAKRRRARPAGEAQGPAAL